ncbi:MAG: glycosyltransferase [Gemmatimonadota bacterium]|nr:glycosyltransferase [Gemmatimonadota bacterium]
MSSDDQVEPTVSIILPTYNRWPFLNYAIQSVIAQTFSAWELIVVDDGSTDATPAFLADLGDERIQIMTLEHCGNPALVRNRGIEAARGKYVAFLDSDDEWTPQKLCVQITAMERHPDCQWSYTAVTLIDPKGQTLPQERFKSWHPYSGRILEKLLAHDAMVACASVVVTRELVNQAKGFDETYLFSGDYELWIRLARMSRVLAIPRQLAKVRIHPTTHTYRQPEVNAAFARIYENVLSTNPSARVRRICRRQVAFYRAYYADQLAAGGAYGSALRHLVGAFRYHPVSRRAWRVLGKHVIRRLAHAIGRSNRK